MNKDERIELIISFEDGSISDKDLIKLFKHLKKTKLVYSLQGCYGRTLKVLEEQGYIN